MSTSARWTEGLSRRRQATADANVDAKELDPGGY
jgi:hypothetical protein